MNQERDDLNIESITELVNDIRFASLQSQVQPSADHSLLPRIRQTRGTREMAKKLRRLSRLFNGVPF